MAQNLTNTIYELVAVMSANADRLLRDHYNVSFNQFHFLAVVADIEPDDITAIAECLGVSRAAVSKRVPVLEAEGWVTTASDTDHGRRVVVSLTPRART